MARRLTNIAIGALMLAIAGLIAWLADPEGLSLRGINDFGGLYLGGHYAGTPRLYDIGTHYAWQREELHVFTQSIAFIRPPYYAWMLRPLGVLPYPQAYWIFQALNLAALAALGWFTARRMPGTWPFLLMFPPLVITLVKGQDVGLVACCAMATLWLLERGKPGAAGAVAALCAVKAHLFVFLPIALLFRRGYRTLAMGAAGGVALALVSMAGNGVGIFGQYLRMLQNPTVHIGAFNMPNVYGAAYALNAGEPVAIALGIVAAGLVVALCGRSASVEEACAWALLGGLLVNNHAALYDCVMVLPALVYLRPTNRASNALRLALLTPFPYLGLALGRPWGLLASGLLLGLLACEVGSRYLAKSSTVPVTAAA